MALYEFPLPDVAEGLSEGEIVRWHVAEGEPVRSGQIFVDVQTDKAIVEIPSPVNGVVARHGAAVGEVLAVGALLAAFDTDETPVATPGHGAPAASGGPAPAAESAPAPARAAAPRGRVRASPATRKRAVELGVDLTTVTGSGSRGQITRADVESAAAQTGDAPVPRATPPAAPAPVPAGTDTEVPLAGLRRRIAETMQSAWREVPHIFTFESVDATGLAQARASLAEELGDDVRLTFMPLFIKACVAALKANPSFNASIDMAAGRIVYRGRINIGFATAAPDGLIVPVVHDADTKSLADIAREVETLSTRARERRITVGELSGGTFTISNYGSYGAHMGTPIIRPPEVAIAGFGRIRDQVVPVDGTPAVRKELPLAVSTDHRLNDGDHLGRFTRRLMACLAEPVRLLA